MKRVNYPCMTVKQFCRTSPIKILLSEYKVGCLTVHLYILHELRNFGNFLVNRYVFTPLFQSPLCIINKYVIIFYALTS